MGSDADEPVSAEILDPDASGEWDEVRESWVDSDLMKLEPAGRGSRNAPAPDRNSAPPPLPPPHVVTAMLERLAVADYDGTLIAARAALAIHPTNQDAIQCRDIAGSSLRTLYLDRLGAKDGKDRVPHATGSTGWLDRRTRTVLDLVDGERTILAICAASPLETLDTLRILSELLLSNGIALAEG